MREHIRGLRKYHINYYNQKLELIAHNSFPTSLLHYLCSLSYISWQYTWRDIICEYWSRNYRNSSGKAHCRTIGKTLHPHKKLYTSIKRQRARQDASTMTIFRLIEPKVSSNINDYIDGRILWDTSLLLYYMTNFYLNDQKSSILRFIDSLIRILKISRSAYGSW